MSKASRESVADRGGNTLWRAQGGDATAPFEVDPHLSKEERIATRAVAEQHCRGTDIARRQACADADVFGDRIRIEAPKVDAPHSIKSVELRDMSADLVRPVGRGRPERRQDQKWIVGN